MADGEGTNTERTMYPLHDGIGKVQLLEWMGGDAAIVNRARKCYQSQERSSPERDAKLLEKLIEGKPMHGTTLRGTVMTFDVIAPLFVVRQWTRHIVGHDADGCDIWHTGGGSFDAGAAFDEQSLRYTEANAAFYVPDQMRIDNGEQYIEWKLAQSKALNSYVTLRKMGVAKELARCFLPASVYSQFEWTVNLQGVFDWHHKRKHGSGAQWEMSQYADSVFLLVHEHVAPRACDSYLE